MYGKSGNQCVYCLYITSSVLVFLSGLVNVASGVGTCIEIGDFNWYNGGFIFLGLLLIVISIFTYKSKTSFNVITFYSISLVVLFLAQLAFTLGLIFYYDFESKLEKKTKADAVRYTLLGTCLIILASCVLSWAYRLSLVDAMNPSIKFEKLNLKKINKSDTDAFESLV